MRSLLLTLQLGISLGIDGIPLACVGAAGYFAKLTFWIIAPLIGIAATVCVGVARVQIAQRGRASLTTMLYSIAPVALRIFFLIYPITTNVAFEAFACFDVRCCTRTTVETGRRGKIEWRVGDVAASSPVSV